MSKKLFTLLCCMAFYLCGKAAVVITDPTPDSIKILAARASASSWFAIDFNHDAVEDYNFSWSYGRFGGGSIYCYGPSGNEISSSGTAGSGSAIIAAIDSGISIDATHTWADASASTKPLFHDGSTAVDFAGAGTKYIGVRFKIGTDTHYGWIKVRLATGSSDTLTVLSYGYETTPSHRLPAGDPTGYPILKPVADYNTLTTTTDTKTAVTFTDASTNTPTAWEWTFTPATVTFTGGTSATSQNPQVLFSAAGKYTVKLKAINAGGSDSITKTDYMTVLTTPVADFTTTATTTDTKTIMTFTDASANMPATWEWTFTPATVTFMGGTSMTSQNPQVQFMAAGKYTVKLKATNMAGSDSITKMDYMVVNAPIPVIDFIASATLTDTKTIVTFTDKTANTPTAWEWTFSPATVTFMGGTGATSQNPQVLFGVKGKYTVKLKASNADGSDSSTKINYIEVEIPTGINTYTTDGELLRIFPNPASKSLTIQNPGEGIMSILDINGKTEWSAPVNGKTMQVDISRLPKGYYTLRVAGEHGVTNSKLIVQ